MIHVVLTPAEYSALTPTDLAPATCVVFDILRATSTMVTALAAGATAILPVVEVATAVERRRGQPDALLGGERGGQRLRAVDTGGVEFDFGNSPAEYTPARVAGRVIITTTTNGTRALHACAGAAGVLAGSFLNLAATARELIRRRPATVFLICAGTHENTAFEDVLGAGALLERLESGHLPGVRTDAALLALATWRQHRADLAGAFRLGENGRRLAELPELAADLVRCAAIDTIDLAAALGPDGAVHRCPPAGTGSGAAAQ